MHLLVNLYVTVTQKIESYSQCVKESRTTEIRSDYLADHILLWSICRRGMKISGDIPFYGFKKLYQSE